LGEREHRTQPVVIVKPAEEETDSTEDKAEKITDLEKAIQDEKQRKRLLELKLKSLRERVETERRKAGLAPKSMTQVPSAQEAGQRSDRHSVAPSEETDSDQRLVREYIWVPERREGDKVIEGGYKLEVR
jgi:hypothetical protein